ncbi:MAG TPA: lysophospholipid acyltransferase family protein [Polyangiaceae bacterium]|nr:lysophospholipid acyltransferase family protein [Polyangiaceae bacterium]
MLRAVLTIITWIELFLVATLGFVFMMAVYLPTRLFDSRRLLSGRALRLVAVAAAKFNPFWRFRVVGPLPKKRPRRAVCVSNHLSYTDIFLISHLPWEMKWLSKASIFRIPCVGWGMWLVGDVPLARGSAQSTKAALVRCAAWLRRDVPVMIFPEGTRSQTGDLLPFKDGAFRIAIETGADVLPIAVWGTQGALPKNDWRAGFARGVVTVGEPISTRGMTLADTGRLKEQARAQISALLEGLRSGEKRPVRRQVSSV